MKKFATFALALMTPFCVEGAFAQTKLPDEAPLVEQGPEGRTRIGILACEIEGGIGLVLGSSRKVSCSFENSDTGKTETYDGRINKFGLDIGVTGTQYMRWAVFGTEAGAETTGLAGKYAGVSAAGALGVAFGGNALIGGSDKQLVLQPFSIQAGTGINVALGVSSLTLERVE
ncbi:DUF992 domain-containing protein [Roseibium sp.]|uniref:DUF992 domain-containing protein n=1 Tax=Roseibium sp. TaxID=1936156 RepID=UPI003A9696CB